MLVLSRARDTAICIDSDITIRVLAIHKRQVTLGIEAPSGVHIWRQELVPICPRRQPAIARPLCRSR
jgi:carbon storage regulator